MKKFLLTLAIFVAAFAQANAQSMSLAEIDEKYKIEDYTIPSFTPFLVAKVAATANPTEANMETLYQRIAELKTYQHPYDVVVNINGDPTTRMAFAWYTNDRMTDGEVQLTPITDLAALTTVFDTATNVMAIPATPTATKKSRYAIGLSGIPAATGVPMSTKYKYTSHKAIAENLTPNTIYAYRV